jgi:glycosyltransferase involved in cell wall biosynthesis
MRILVALGDDRGQAYWRNIMPLSRLPEHTVLFTDTIDRAMFRSADLVFMSRVSTPEMLDLLKELRQAGKPVVVDFDDNLHQHQHNPEARGVYSTGKWGTKLFEEALPLPSVVTCSTRRLASEYAKWRPDIEVVENFIPDALFERLSPTEITGAPKREGEIRVGYAGSSTHGGDLALVARPLRKLCAKYPEVRLVFFGQEPPTSLSAVPWEYVPYIDPDPGEQMFAFMDRYFERLKSLELDVAIAPLVPNIFNQSKSALKILEYGSCGWPVVASSVGPYREYRARNDMGILTAYDEKEWLGSLDALVSSQPMRRDLAQRNDAYIRGYYTSAVGLAAWRRIIEMATLTVAV